MTPVSYLPYTITLNAPALLTDLGGDPNSSSSLAYIPGAAIRGAVARALGDPDKDPGDSAKRERFHRLVLSGAVRYLNAYPVAGSVRAFPAPVSVRVEKDAPENAHDLSLNWPEEQLRPAEWSFLKLESGDNQGVSVDFEGAIHNQRDRERGRAWKRPDGSAAGAIFHYEAVSANQRFAGVIAIEGESEASVEELKATLKDRHLFGRSRRSEYGGDGTLIFGQLQKRELTQVAESVAAGERFRCVLLSRYVGRDQQTGQPDPMAIEEEISLAFGGECTVVDRFFAYAIAGGYNRKWRLQLPQTPVLEAGSVLVLRSEKSIDREQLEAVEGAGFGERRIEGFGRVAFLKIRPPLLAKPENAKKHFRPSTAVPSLVARMQAELLCTHLDRAIDQLAAELARAGKSIPSPALLSRIRTPLRSGVAGLQELLRWLNPGPHALSRRALEPLQQCRLTNGLNLAEWLRATATDGPTLPGERIETIAQRTYLADKSHAQSLLASRSSEQETRVRLIDTTLATLIRLRKLAEQERSNV